MSLAGRVRASPLAIFFLLAYFFLKGARALASIPLLALGQERRAPTPLPAP